MGDKDETRNLILAVVLSMAVIVGWYAIFPPEVPPEQAAAPAGQSAEQGAGPGAGGTDGERPVTGAAEGAVAQVSRARALEQTERVPVATPTVSGSISLKGGRLDDLHLDDYRETIAADADTVVLLNPTAAPDPYYVVYGWLRTAAGDPGALPGPSTEWRLAEGERLTPETPVTLAWENDSGLSFTRTFSIDDKYMVQVSQAVENGSGTAVDLAPYAYVARRGLPDTQGMWILHEGAVGAFDGELVEIDYDDMLEFQQSSLQGGRTRSRAVTNNGWLGFTDKYWMTTLVPEPGQPFDAIWRAIPGPNPEFRAEVQLPVRTVAPGERATVETRIFAGAKEVSTIRNYEADLGIAQFEDAVDWGWFYFLTKPLFTALDFFNGLLGNMGWAIICLTLAIKAILFPLAYKSYVSMSKMKALQPDMEKIKERAGDDKQKLQQEMMALYKEKKVNPAAGCLPILLQIPIFFSLYKVLFVTIEVRHAEFLYIPDLSAPDPLSWMTLFGAFPWDIPVFLQLFSIGLFPIAMGITMWLQQKLNPAPTDETQRIIFAWMPWVFMFMLGQFAAGLVIYWTANNVITIIQQYLIMRSQGVDVDLLGNIKQSFKKRPAEAAASAGAVAGGKGAKAEKAEKGSKAAASEKADAADDTAPDTGADGVEASDTGTDTGTGTSEGGDGGEPTRSPDKPSANRPSRPAPQKRKAKGPGNRRSRGGRR